jgi:hypothetical protein
VRTVKALLIGGLATAWLITALAVPVSAADAKGTLAIVNGIPGARVDVCINGKEVRSAMRYGKAAVRTLPPGPKILTVRATSPGLCTGKRLSKRSFAFPKGSDLTVILTKKTPSKILLFDNTPPFLGTPSDTPSGVGTHLAMRNGSDLGPVAIHYYWNDPGLLWYPSPSAGHLFDKGVQSIGYAFTGILPVNLWVSRPDDPRTLAGPVRKEFVEGYRYEWTIVGTSKRNARILFMARPVTMDLLPA